MRYRSAGWNLNPKQICVFTFEQKLKMKLCLFHNWKWQYEEILQLLQLYSMTQGKISFCIGVKCWICL